MIINRHKFKKILMIMIFQSCKDKNRDKLKKKVQQTKIVLSKNMRRRLRGENYKEKNGGKL